LASSSSTALLAPSSIKLAVNAVLRRTQHREVLEGARRLQLLNRRRPRLHLIGLVDRALHRDAHIGHLSPRTGGRLGDVTCASAAKGTHRRRTR
jgi:hypothetical protein